MGGYSLAEWLDFGKEVLLLIWNMDWKVQLFWLAFFLVFRKLTAILLFLIFFILFNIAFINIVFG